MVGTWLLELYLDQLNRSLLVIDSHNDGSTGQDDADQEAKMQTTTGQNGKGQNGTHPAAQLTERLRNFLKRNVDVLDVNVTVSLLAGYGRLDDLMEYASYRKVWPPPICFFAALLYFPNLPTPFLFCLDMSV